MSGGRRAGSAGRDAAPSEPINVQVALTLYLATLCTGAGAIVLQKTGWTGALLVFAQTLMILLIIAILETTGQTETNDESN